jgi:hypothetical protein
VADNSLIVVSTLELKLHISPCLVSELKRCDTTLEMQLFSRVYFTEQDAKQPLPIFANSIAQSCLFLAEGAIQLITINHFENMVALALEKEDWTVAMMVVVDCYTDSLNQENLVASLVRSVCVPYIEFVQKMMVKVLSTYGGFFPREMDSQYSGDIAQLSAACCTLIDFLVSTNS